LNMWSFIEPINLIRYLCVWRVNRALVRLPAYLPTELSQVLGAIIAGRLPTRQAGLWLKTLAAETLTGLLEPTWPVESVLFAYPGKRYYGPGEPIFWELKLLGHQADHSFFLEVILPAMEAAGQTTDPRWYQSNTLWGRFDIQAIYVARGSRWEALVSDGRLDTRYQAEPMQWAEGLSFTPSPEDNRSFKSLTWLTPVDLRPSPAPSGSLTIPPAKPEPVTMRPHQQMRAHEDDVEIPIPTLQLILEALLARVAQLTPGKYTTPGDVWNMLPPDEQAVLWDAVAQADEINLRRSEAQPIPTGWPSGWLGEQTFAPIPASLLPYLELAAILHLGRHTHLGCGTFVM
jgi:hypothetical protein